MTRTTRPWGHSPRVKRQQLLDSFNQFCQQQAERIEPRNRHSLEDELEAHYASMWLAQPMRQELELEVRK